jgi:hypothetical protein
MQSNEEVIRIAKDWVELYAPKNLREDSAEALITWVLEHDGGLMSFSGLNRAVQALGDQVLVPERSANEIAMERAARGDKHMRDEFFKSLKPEAQKPLVDHQKKEAEKELKTIKDEITKEIENHFVAHHLGPNYSRTESERETLRQVLAQYKTDTVANAKLALSAVREAKAKLTR